MLIISNLIYQISIGPGAWVYTAEVMPPKGVGLANTWNWGLTTLVAEVVPMGFNSILKPSGVFLVFSGFTFIVFSE